MTKEEIISNLLYMKRSVKEDTIEDITINEAIKALEQESCDDVCEWFEQYVDIATDIVELRFSDGTVKRAKRGLYLRDIEKSIRKMLIDQMANEKKPEPCTDAISRQAVAEVLLKYAHSAEGKAFAEFLISQINALPPVTPQYTEAEIQRMQDLEFAEIQKAYEIGKAEKPNKSEIPTGWIPVSERLPEKGKQVLCCNKSGSVFTSAITYINSNGMVAFGQHYKVIAWMPLPEPYKQEVEE